MIKSSLKVKQNVDVSKFFKTIAFLKKQSVGFQPKKANVFTSDQVAKFMIKASDNEWLLAKVILTFGIFGASRRDDLLGISTNDVKDCSTFFTVFLRDGKTHTSRSFTITDDDCPYQPCELVRKYLSLRPPQMKSNRLFIGYRKGKCVAQNVGTHAVAAVPKNIAIFLKLEQPETYTGHSMRRSSASMLVEGGADLLTLKKYGGWKSSAVAEGYVEDSISRKIQVSKKLFSTPSTSTTNENTFNIPTNKDMPVDAKKGNSSSNDYFTIDDLFELEENVGEGTSESAVNVSKNQTTLNMVTSKLPGKVMNISNNENCSFKINFHFHK